MKRMVCAVICMGIFWCAGLRADEPGQQKIAPKKVLVDTNFDGKQDRTELYDEKGQIQRVESDTNFDGTTDEWIFYKDGKPVKSDKDTNKDGKPDVWVEY